MWDFQDCGEEKIGKVCASFIGRKIGYLRLCSMLARLITYLVRISISIVGNLCYFKLHVKYAMLKFILREQCNLNCSSLEVSLAIDLGVFLLCKANVQLEQQLVLFSWHIRQEFAFIALFAVVFPFSACCRYEIYTLYYRVVIKQFC